MSPNICGFKRCATEETHCFSIKLNDWGRSTITHSKPVGAHRYKDTRGTKAVSTLNVLYFLIFNLWEAATNRPATDVFQQKAFIS